MKPLVYALAGAGVVIALAAGPVAGQSRPAPPGGGGGGAAVRAGGSSGGSSGGAGSTGGGNAVSSPGASGGGSARQYRRDLVVRILGIVRLPRCVGRRQAGGRRGGLDDEPGERQQPARPGAIWVAGRPGGSARVAPRWNRADGGVDSLGRADDRTGHPAPARRAEPSGSPASGRRLQHQLGIRPVDLLRARLLQRPLRRSGTG